MILTNSQIQQLYKFTRQHFVEHYDVQMELVDHLANDIEVIWEESPTLTFEQARDKSFKKFGVFGFMDILGEKQNAMTKRYRKILWRFTKEWFKIPKIVITLSIFLFFFSTLQFNGSTYFFLGIILFLTLLNLIKTTLIRKKFKKKKERKEKIFLLESMIENTQNSFSSLTLINIFNIINLTKVNFNSLAIHWIFLIAICATLLCIIFYVTGFVIPKKAQELLEETYPEYKFVTNP